MRLRRIGILYLALPLALSAILGIRGSSWLPELSKSESIFLYTSFILPAFLIGAGATYLGLLVCRRLSIHPAFALVGGAILAVLIGYFFSNANMYFAGLIFPGLENAQTADGRKVWGSFFDWLTSPDTFTFVPVWFGMHLIYEWGSRDVVFFPWFSRDSNERNLEISDAQASIFLSRVPNHLRDSIIALEADKHYTVVYAENGEGRILYRFGDAVIELEALNLGIRVHRSWWVAWNSVRALESDGRTMSIQLLNGQLVPVSQTNIAAVRRKWGHLPPHVVTP